MAKMYFGGVEENVVTREEYPLAKALETLKDETIAVIGYGVQGPGQSLNLRDNGFNVIATVAAAHGEPCDERRKNIAQMHPAGGRGCKTSDHLFHDLTPAWTAPRMPQRLQWRRPQR